MSSKKLDIDKLSFEEREVISERDLDWLLEKGYIISDVGIDGYVLRDETDRYKYIKLNYRTEHEECMYRQVIKRNRRFVTVRVDGLLNPLCPEIDYYIPEWCFVDFWHDMNVRIGE